MKRTVIKRWRHEMADCQMVIVLLTVSSVFIMPSQRMIANFGICSRVPTFTLCLISSRLPWTCADNNGESSGVISEVLIQAPVHAIFTWCTVFGVGLGSGLYLFLFNIHVGMFVSDYVWISETQVLSALSLPPPHSPPPRTLFPYSLFLVKAALSTGRLVCGATHVLTLPWQLLSTPCPPSTLTLAQQKIQTRIKKLLN